MPGALDHDVRSLFTSFLRLTTLRRTLGHICNTLSHLMLALSAPLQRADVDTHHIDLPGFSFFFYFQLRSALKAQCPMATTIRPLYTLFTLQGKNRGRVSTLYRIFLEASYQDLPLDRVWRLDCPDLDLDFDWGDVWLNIKEASHNPNHQQIHYNYSP